MASESSMHLGTCVVFQKKMKLEVIPMCIIHSDCNLKIGETNHWVREFGGQGGFSSFSHSKGFSRNVVQFSSFVVPHKASVNRPEPHVLLFITFSIFHLPNSTVFSVKATFMIKVNNLSAITRHKLNAVTMQNKNCKAFAFFE